VVRRRRSSARRLNPSTSALTPRVVSRTASSRVSSPVHQSSSTARPAATIIRASVLASRVLAPVASAMRICHGASRRSMMASATRASSGSGPLASSKRQGPAPRDSIVSHTASTKTRATAALLPGMLRIAPRPKRRVSSAAKSSSTATISA